MEWAESAAWVAAQSLLTSAELEPRSHRRPDSHTTAADPGDGDAALDTSADAVAIIAEPHSGFRSIDARLNTLNSRLDHMGERLQSTGLDGAEDRISGLQNNGSSMKKRLERMELILKTIAAKYEDVEVRSC
ncbi:hypothetical protein NDU88_002761 [Pleurodeles waltl]|uniref:Uncharacterized protein n=1 Tax=Pleurodeles waltl TaxID=8319 RepID=A0AAV7NEX5_PLEWA|nr:hypothetical protein NDU88_002761 [Pleurodeles waltl]